jgi:hypothetical protein
MEKFERNGVLFTTFERDGELYLCTGEPTGEVKFSFAGEIRDYYEVVGATSVVSGKESIDKLYETWLEQTRFYREHCGIKY